MAKTKENGLTFAIKCFAIDDLNLDYLISEFKIQMFCNHPNILQSHGFFIGKDEIYLLMELGFKNLYREIKQEGRLSERKTANYIWQVLQGLLYLHDHGIIHRDLKPENIIIFHDGTVKICDFGWAIHTKYQRKTFCGTFDYVSPEVANGDHYDFKIDCWSVGILTYEMLTSTTPFDQKRMLEKPK